MTDPDLRQLALDYVAGRVYTTADVPKDLWRLVFMPLFFVEHPAKTLRGVRLVCGVSGRHKTTGQAINGFPMFFEVQMLKAGETKRFWGHVKRARALTTKFIGRPTIAPRAPVTRRLTSRS